MGAVPGSLPGSHQKGRRTPQSAPLSHFTCTVSHVPGKTGTGAKSFSEGATENRRLEDSRRLEEWVASILEKCSWPRDWAFASTRLHELCQPRTETRGR